MIQSLLTQDEYNKFSKYYDTYNPSGRSNQEDGTTAPPNYIMGDSLTITEIKLINSRMIAVMEKVGVSYHFIPDYPWMQPEI